MVVVKNIIDQIKQAEQESAQIMDQAKAGSSEIVEDAYRQCRQIQAQGEKEAKNLIKDGANRARADAAQEIEEIHRKLDQDLEKIRKTGTKKQKKAIDWIIKKVFD